MSTVMLSKWGNSIGIRLPSNIIKSAHLNSGDLLDISINKKGELKLVPIHDKQSDWMEKFNAVADAQSEKSLLDIKNDFDEEEWTW